MKRVLLSLKMPILLGVFISAACSGGDSGAPSGPPKIVAIMPPQPSYPVGQTIGIKTEEDCSDCTVLLEEKEVPLAGYYTLTVPVDEGTPKTEELQTTVGPGVVLPDIVTGCPKNNKIDNGCVVFVRVVQKGLKSNQRAVLVIQAGREEASPATTPDQVAPQLTAPTAGTPATPPPLPTSPTEPVSPASPPTSPVTSVTTGTAPPPVQAGDTTNTPVSSGTQKTPGKTGPPSTRPSPPRPPVVEDEESRDEEPEGPSPSEDDSDDGETVTPEAPEPEPGPASGPEKPEPVDKKIPIKTDDTSGTCPYAADVDPAVLIRDMRVAISSDESLSLPRQFPVMKLIFCPQLPINSGCPTYTIDPRRSSDRLDDRTLRSNLIDETRALVESRNGDKIPLANLNYLRFEILPRSDVQGLVLDNITVEARIDTTAPQEFLRIYERRNLQQKMNARGGSTPAFVDFESGCVASDIPPATDSEPAGADKTSIPADKYEPETADAAIMIDDIRVTVEPQSSRRGPQDFPLMQVVFCPTNAFGSLSCHRFDIDPDPNQDVPEPQFTGLGLVAKFRHGLNAVETESYNEMVYPADVRHLEFSLMDSYGVRGPRIFSLRRITIEAKQDGNPAWHRCEDIHKEDLGIHNLDTRGRSHPVSFTLELECQ